MAAKMTDWKSDIITALLGTIYPSTRDDADLARRAGKEGLARLMETDGAKLDFVRDAVSSEIFQEACASSWHITIASDSLMSVGCSTCLGGSQFTSIIPHCCRYFMLTIGPSRLRWPHWP